MKFQKGFSNLFSIGGRGYTYTNTRIKFKKGLLLRPEIFQKLIKISLPEITNFLEKTLYKKEIDELRTKFSGINLIEYALNKNLEKTFQNILKFSLQDSKTQIRLYLQRYDVANIKTIIRGKYHKTSDKRIIFELIACGEFTREFLEKVVNKSKDVDDTLEFFKKTEYYETFKKNNNNLSKLEDELDKFYYMQILKYGAKELKDYIGFEIWVKNSLNKLRSQKGKIKIELIPDEKPEKIDIPLKEDSVETRIFLKKLLISKSLNMANEFKMNIRPVLGYFVAKENEINNIRIIARGKYAGLPDEMIVKQLVF